MKRTLSAAVLAGALSTGAALIPVSSVVAQEAPPVSSAMEEWKDPFDPQNFPPVKSGELVSSDDLSLGIAYLPQIAKYTPMSSGYYEDFSKSRGLKHRFVFYLGGDQKSNADFQFDTEFFDVSTGESTGIKMSNTWVDGQSSNSDELLSLGEIGGGENTRAFAFDHLTQSPELVKLRGKTVTPITHVTHIQSGKKITIGDSDPKKAQDRNKVHIFDLTADPEVSEFSVKDGVKTSVNLTMKNLPPAVKSGTLMHHFHLFKDGKPIESAVLHAGMLEGDIDVKPDPESADGATTASIKGEFVIPAEYFDAIKEEFKIDSLDGYELRYMPSLASENYHELIDLMWTKDKFDVTQFTAFLTDVTTIKLKDAKDGDELDTSQPPIDEGSESDDPENPGTGDEGGEIPEEVEDAGDDKEQSPEELAPEDNRDGSSEEDEGSSGDEKAGDGKGGNSRDGAGKGTESGGAAEDLAPEDGDTEGTEGEGEDDKSNEASEVKTGGEVASKGGVIAAGIASLMAFAAGAVGLITRRKKQ